MSLEAIALLKIPYAEICAAHDLEPASSAAQALEELSTFIPVGKDGTACVLDLPLASSPEELADAAWDLVGDKLAAHRDERGVLVVPDKGFGDADLSSYDDAVAHFGDAGQWIVPTISEARTESAMAEQMKAMLGSGEMEAQLRNNPQVMAALGGAPGGDLLQMAQQMLAQMSPEQQAQLEQMAKSMFGNLDPSMLAGLGAPAARGLEDEATIAEDSGEDPEFGSGDEPTTIDKK